MNQIISRVIKSQFSDVDNEQVLKRSSKNSQSIVKVLDYFHVIEIQWSSRNSGSFSFNLFCFVDLKEGVENHKSFGSKRDFDNKVKASYRIGNLVSSGDKWWVIKDPDSDFRELNKLIPETHKSESIFVKNINHWYPKSFESEIGLICAECESDLIVDFEKLSQVFNGINKNCPTR